MQKQQAVSRPGETVLHLFGELHFVWAIKAGRPGLKSREVRAFYAKVFRLILIWHCQGWHLGKTRKSPPPFKNDDPGSRKAETQGHRQSRGWRMMRAYPDPFHMENV